MQKDIRIELLESIGTTTTGSNLLSNYSFSSSANWDTATQGGGCGANKWVISGGKIEKSDTSICSYFRQPITLQEGFRYQAVVNIKNYNRNSSILLANHGVGGANITVANSSIIANGADGNTSTSKSIPVEWVQGSSNLDKFVVYGGTTAACTINYITLKTISTLKSAVSGILDAATTDDFPLALTFSINDPSNIDNRKGSYSKTFQIPATSNNNQVLKHFNVPNSTLLDSALYEKIPCRILVGGFFSLEGLLQVQEVQRANDKPIFYSCVFLGDNLGWSTALETKYLSDLQLPNSTNLELTAKEITKTWQADSCDSSTTRAGTNTVNTSPVVYPVTTYGKTNEGNPHNEKSMQLLRTQYEADWASGYSTANSSATGVYNTLFGAANNQPSAPVVDWRPQVWIYNMMHKIFNDVGYKLSSSFVESNEFKKLVYATPNFLFNDPQVRFLANTYLGNFKDESTVSGCTPPSSTNLRYHREHELQTFGPFQNQAGYWLYQYANITAASKILFSGPDCAGNEGSRRYQPLAGSTTSSNSLNEQDTKMSLSTAGGKMYNKFTIGESGYYTVSARNHMMLIDVTQWSSSGSMGDWSGVGQYNSNTSPTYVEMWGGWAIQVLPPAAALTETNWENGTIDSNYDDSSQHLGKIYAKQAFNLGVTLDNYSYTGYFNKGDRIRFIIQTYREYAVHDPNVNFTSTSPNGMAYVNMEFMLWGTQYNNWSATNGEISIEMFEPEKPAFSCTYDLQDVLPNTQKQLDFVKGIAHCFNLQFYTSEAEKTVYLEPFTSFYLPPSFAIDWTDKLDRGKDDVMAFLQSDFTRRLIFKYKTDDNDYQVERMGINFFQGVLDNYPKIIDLANTYPAGETVFENPFFAGTYDSQSMHIAENMVNVDSNGYPTKNFYAAALWTGGPSSPKAYDFMPRILFYNKMTMPSVHNPMWQGFSTETTGWPSPYGLAYFQFAKNQVSDYTTYTLGTFPYYTNFSNAFYTSATFINRHDYTNQFGLSYGNYWAKDYNASDNSYTAVGNQVGRGLYSRYYQPMIDNLLKNPKTRRCYIDLKPKDIVQLDFRKLVYIDGVYYRVVKVIDYQPHLNVTTKVELHQWQMDEGSSLPQEGVWVNPNSTGVGGSGEPAPWPPTQEA